MSVPPMVCKTCRRALARIVEKETGAVSWQHEEQDILAGHKPIPVSQEDVGVIGRCDFCNQDLGSEKFSLPVRTFLAGRRPTDGKMQGYEGDWMACPTCAKLIDGNRWNQLLRHVQECWERDHGIPAPPDKVVGWAHLYRLVRKNISGSLRRA